MISQTGELQSLIENVEYDPRTFAQLAVNLPFDLPEDCDFTSP